MYPPLAELLVPQQMRERLATAERQRLLRVARPTPCPSLLTRMGPLVVRVGGHWLRRAPHGTTCGDPTQAPLATPCTTRRPGGGGHLPSCLGGRPHCPGACAAPHSGR